MYDLIFDVAHARRTGRSHSSPATTPLLHFRRERRFGSGLPLDVVPRMYTAEKINSTYTVLRLILSVFLATQVIDGPSESQTSYLTDAL